MLLSVHRMTYDTRRGTCLSRPIGTRVRCESLQPAHGCVMLCCVWFCFCFIASSFVQPWFKACSETHVGTQFLPNNPPELVQTKSMLASDWVRTCARYTVFSMRSLITSGVSSALRAFDAFASVGFCGVKLHVVYPPLALLTVVEFRDNWYLVAASRGGVPFRRTPHDGTSMRLLRRSLQ